MTRHRDDHDGSPDGARADDTPTHPAPIAVLGALLEAFRRDPTDGDAFAGAGGSAEDDDTRELLVF